VKRWAFSELHNIVTPASYRSPSRNSQKWRP
jgi:hypothetical protein